MDFEEISTAPWWAKNTALLSCCCKHNRGRSLFEEIMNTAPPFLPPIGGSALPTLITWKKGWIGLNIPRSSSVGGSSPLFFNCFIGHLMR